jgi:hypothetical protein
VSREPPYKSARALAVFCSGRDDLFEVVQIPRPVPGRSRWSRLETRGPCPADGTELEEVEHLREAVVEAALAQDAEVIVVKRYPDLGPHRGMAALLRF